MEEPKILFIKYSIKDANLQLITEGNYITKIHFASFDNLLEWEDYLFSDIKDFILVKERINTNSSEIREKLNKDNLQVTIDNISILD